MIPSIASCVFFVERGSARDITIGLTYAETAINVLFIILWILRFAAAPTVATLLRADSIIDILSFGSYATLLFASCAWVPSGIQGFSWVVGAECVPGTLNLDLTIVQPPNVIARTWFSFSYLRAWYLQNLFVYLEALATPSRPPSFGWGLTTGAFYPTSWLAGKPTYGMIKFFVRVLAVLFMFTCTIYALTLLGEIPALIDNPLIALYMCPGGIVQAQPYNATGYQCDQTFALFTSFYFSIVTLATVGYGDFVPDTFMSRLFVCFAIVVGVAVFVQWSSELLALLTGSRAGTGSYSPDTAGRHVLVCGAPSVEQVREFVAQLLHASRRPANDVNVVFLCAPPSRRGGHEAVATATSTRGYSGSSERTMTCAR